MAAGPESRAGGGAPPPSVWRVARAILPLPFVATVIVPALIVATDPDAVGSGGGALRVAAIAVGAGLIGLRAGQSINWPGLDGSPRVLSVLEVTSAA